MISRIRSNAKKSKLQQILEAELEIKSLTHLKIILLYRKKENIGKI
jgi:hypothetical protein